MSYKWGSGEANNDNSSDREEMQVRKADVLAFFVHSYAFDAHSSKLYVEYLTDNDWIDIVSEIYNSTQIFFTLHDAQEQYEQHLLKEFHDKEDELIEWALAKTTQFNLEQNLWFRRRQMHNTNWKSKHKYNELDEQVTASLHDHYWKNSENLHEKSAEESSMFIKSEKDETNLSNKCFICLESSTRQSSSSSLNTLQSSLELSAHVESKSLPSSSTTTFLANKIKKEQLMESTNYAPDLFTIPSYESINNEQIKTHRNVNHMQEIREVRKQNESIKSDVEDNNMNVIKKEVENEHNDNIGQVWERNVCNCWDSASEIDKWICQLATEQRYFAQKLRYDTILRGDILIGLLQQCFCVIGADVFFHPVPSNTTMEYNGIRLGSYQTVIYRPMSLMLIKRMIAESKRECYHLLHRSMSSHNNKSKNSCKEFKDNNNNNNTITKLQQSVLEKESVCYSRYDKDDYKESHEELSEQNSDLCSQDETLSNRSSQNGTVNTINYNFEQSNSKQDRYVTNNDTLYNNDNVHADRMKCKINNVYNNTSNNNNDSEMTEKTNDITCSANYSGMQNTMTPTTSMKRSRSESSDNDDISSMDSNSISHYGSRHDDIESNTAVLLLLHEHSHPLRIATLAELERSLWLIAANCVMFNAPETYYPQTARRFISACMHVLLNFCKRQMAMHFRE